ncbi:MAG: CBS domain-containing protein [Deltaproteobacteria bacterium]|nr:CBS domain-containing protein [Deltaproteobacteria bacterium]
MARQKNQSKAICVADWMSTGVLAVETFDSIAIARQLMAKHRINQLPVLDDDRLIGIVTDRDIRDAYPTSMMIDRTEAIDEFAEKVTVEEVMTRDIFIVRPETPLLQAVALLRKHRIGSLPVVRDEQLEGIITRSDILDFVLGGSVKGQRDAPPRAKKKPTPGRKKD